ncbi:ATP-binding protein [Spirochaetia bacterium 38H-sp]|uniref:ATP-binding protein n=1 Tax=Rarispira pelagica TaxID=3141764 RepID=A0ABU9UBF4_9SPIR
MRIKLSIHAGAKITEVFALLKKIEMNGFEEESQSIVYALIELISNSLRAQRSKKVNIPVQLIMEIKDNTFLAMIKDHGGGFDPGKLPYDISMPAEKIDTQSHEFKEYREKTNNKHFGLGIYIAKKIFDKLSISFFDGEETQTKTYSPSIQGTIIKCSLKIGAKK